MAKSTLDSEKQELYDILRNADYDLLRSKCFSKEALFATDVLPPYSNLEYIINACAFNEIKQGTFDDWTFQDLTKTIHDGRFSILDVLISNNNDSLFYPFIHIFSNLSLSDMQVICGPTKAKGLFKDEELPLLVHLGLKGLIPLLRDSLEKLTLEELTQPLSGVDNKTLLELATTRNFLHLLDHDVVKQVCTFDYVRKLVFTDEAKEYLSKDDYQEFYEEILQAWKEQKASSTPKDEKSERSNFIKEYTEGSIKFFDDLQMVDDAYSDYYELLGESPISEGQ